jgi:hypothetical protein
MNKIQSYMRQIPQHIKTITKIVSTNGTSKLVNRMLPSITNNIERIGKTCVTLSKGAENSFVFVMNLLGEVLEATSVAQGQQEAELRNKDIELNVTRILHADLKREEEIRRKYYEEIRQAAHKAQAEYSRALDDIPTGWKVLCLELGRAVISLVKSFSNPFQSVTVAGLGLISRSLQVAGNTGTESLMNNQILNFASRFAQSLDSLIRRVSSNRNQTTDVNELKSFKIIFETFSKMMNNLPNDTIKTKVVKLIERATQLVDEAIANKGLNIKDQLKMIANEIIPFTTAEQVSSINNAPVSTSKEDDLSKNELFKAQLAQVRLTETEKRLDAHFAGHIAVMEQVRALTAKLASVDLRIIDLKQILEMLREAFILLGRIRAQWHKLVEFFTKFSAQVAVGFDETFKSFLDTTRDSIDLEKNEVERTLVLELLNGSSTSLHHESYTLFIMSQTYYDVSKKYLMPRIASLSLMLTAPNDNERHRLLIQLEQNTLEIQANVTELINERKAIYQKVISKKRAQLNEIIDAQGADGNELEMIKEAKILLGDEDTFDI